MWSHKLLGPVLGSCRGAPLGAQHPMGLRTAMPTALCTQQTLKHSLEILPLLLKAIFAQSPQVWDTSPLLGVTSRSPGVRGSLCWAWGWPCPPPATVPWWEKTGQSLVCPRGAGLGELSCRPQGGAGRGKETPRKSGGMRRAAHPTGTEAKHLPQPGQPCPREGPRADRHPNPPFGVPKMGQKRSAAGPALPPLIPLGFLPSSQGKTTATSTPLVTTLTLLLGHLRVGDTGVP